MNGCILKNCSCSGRKTTGLENPEVTVHQHCKTFNVTQSFFWKLRFSRTMENELWSCYRSVHKPQPLATWTSSSKANAVSSISTWEGGNPHTTHRDYWGYMKNDELAKKDSCLKTHTDIPTSEHNIHLCGTAVHLYPPADQYIRN